MTVSWPLQKAKHQFNRLVDRAIAEGPQLVTRHGKPVVVVCAIAGATTERKRGTAKQLLTLLRSCPADLTGVAKRDRSARRKIALG